MNDQKPFSPQDIRPAAGYAGDITPQKAWEWVHQDKALLIDVRTSAELAWVGYVPGGVHIAWKEWPGMVGNEQFDHRLEEVAPDLTRPLLFLCRSGQRSVFAAQRATALGYTAAYNILDGFEGVLDAHGHRNTASGWRSLGLPWQQG